MKARSEMGATVARATDREAKPRVTVVAREISSTLRALPIAVSSLERTNSLLSKPSVARAPVYLSRRCGPASAHPWVQRVSGRVRVSRRA